jgi:hypothetical protein
MDGIHIAIVPNTSGTPVGTLADTEVHFMSGPIEGRNLFLEARRHVEEGAARCANAASIPHLNTPTRRRIRDSVDGSVST